MASIADVSQVKSRAVSAETLARDVADTGHAPELAAELAAWIAGSSRFASFVEAHRSKVRKKVRGASDHESLRDVRVELVIARLLSSDRRFELAYEAGGRGGGPDFTITYRAGRPFNLEVTRLRREPDVASLGGVLLGKLRQLPPSSPNLLLVAVEDEAADAVDIGAAVRALRVRADEKDDAYFAFRGVHGSRTFYQRFLRLAGVIVWSETRTGDSRVSWWLNGSARIALPERTLRAVLACLRA
jgi:hypothetical protein